MRLNISIYKTLSISIHKAENFIRFVRLISLVLRLSNCRRWFGQMWLAIRKSSTFVGPAPRARAASALFHSAGLRRPAPHSCVLSYNFGLSIKAVLFPDRHYNLWKPMPLGKNSKCTGYAAGGKQALMEKRLKPSPLPIAILEPLVFLQKS